MDLRFGADGLITAVVQDRLGGQVRMVGHMNREALAATLRTGRVTFFSRSRGTLWEKGESSGNQLHVRSIHADCDADALLVLVDPVGPTCHTGSPSCFFRAVSADGTAAEEGRDAAPFLEELGREIEARKASSAEKSYTRHLLDGGAARLGKKLREEAGELADAVAGETDERVRSEAADVLYHLLVALSFRGLDLRAVEASLASRAGTSGHVEKARR